MKTIKHLPSMLTIVFVLACFNVLVLGQSSDDKNNFANVTSLASSVRFDISAANAGVTLTVIGPDDFAYSKEYKSGTSPEFKLVSSTGNGFLTAITPTSCGSPRSSLPTREKH